MRWRDRKGHRQSTTDMPEHGRRRVFPRTIAAEEFVARAGPKSTRRSGLDRAS